MKWQTAHTKMSLTKALAAADGCQQCSLQWMDGRIQVRANMSANNDKNSDDDDNG